MALRKAQSVALKLEEDPEPANDTAPSPFTPSAVSAASSFTPAPALELDPPLNFIPASRSDRRQEDRREGDRRQGERRGMDALRNEALRNIISNVEDRSFSGLRNNGAPRISLKSPRIPMSRLILLAVALLAGGVAAWLATHNDPAPVPAATVAVETVKPAPATQILVAKTAIGPGQRLAADALQWQDWPEATLRSDYIDIATSPAAMTDMANSVARGEFFPGEPIRAAKVTEAGHGFLSSILDSGKRGVSVTVSAESASGGFIVPTDRVDVVLTRQTGASQISETILSNVQVLAINNNLGSNGASAQSGDDKPVDPATQAFGGGAIATLELDPHQAEQVINATSLGKLSLMLRPTNDGTTDANAPAETAANAAIRLTSPFWATN